MALSKGKNSNILAWALLCAQIDYLRINDIINPNKSRICEETIMKTAFNNTKKRITASSLALVMALSICFSAIPVGNVIAKENDVKENENVVQTQDANTINWETDFEYEIQGDNIVLSKYIGSAEVVNVPATATINGVTYKVKLNDNCHGFFTRCKNIKSISFSKDIDTSNVTDMSEMFDTCRNLTDLDISGFDTSSVTDMHFMFYDCRSLKSVDVSGFDTSKVTSMNCMFFYCENLTNLDVSGFDTSQVTDMFNMFFDCRSLTNLDVSGFDTKNVTNMVAMFGDCRSLSSLDVSGFDTSKVTNMLAMFYNCENLNSLDVSGFNTSLVTNMSEMFGECKGLTSLDVSGFDTSNATNLGRMFYCCSSLKNIDLSGFKTTKVTQMTDFLRGCSSLERVDLSNLDMSSLNDDSTRAYDKMLDGCVSLKEIRTPINMGYSAYLPGVFVLQDDLTTRYAMLPQNQSKSMTLIRALEDKNVYRLYNPFSGEHLYSLDDGEVSYLVGCGWNNEGVCCKAPATGALVYRLYDPASGAHHYTTNESEMDWLISIGWNYEGVGFCSAEGSGDPVYRLFNPHTNVAVESHVFTSNVEERDWLLSLGWNDEGIGWYGIK